jgi:hypothetical protein
MNVFKNLAIGRYGGDRIERQCDIWTIFDHRIVSCPLSDIRLTDKSQRGFDALLLRRDN